MADSLSCNVCFVGAGTVNFGYGDLPWNHSKRLEMLGSVAVVAIVDPRTARAEEILADKLSGENASLYKNCHIYGDIQAAMQKEQIDVAFVGNLMLQCNFSYFTTFSLVRSSSILPWFHCQ